MGEGWDGVLRVVANSAAGVGVAPDRATEEARLPGKDLTREKKGD